MDDNKTLQYRPVSTVETSSNDALSIATLRDLAAALTNFKYQIAKPQICNYLFVNPVSHVGTGVETVVIPPLAPRYIASGYSLVVWSLRHRRTAGAGSATWKIAFHYRLYRGGQVYDSDYGHGVATQNNDTITTDSDSWAITTSTFALVHPNVYLPDGLTWPTLTVDCPVGTTVEFNQLASHCRVE